MLEKRNSSVPGLCGGILRFLKHVTMRYVVCGEANQLLVLCTGILAESQDGGRIAEGLVQSSQGPLCQGCRRSGRGSRVLKDTARTGKKRPCLCCCCCFATSLTLTCQAESITISDTPTVIHWYGYNFFFLIWIGTDFC